MTKIDIKSINLKDLQANFLDKGLQKFRAVQIYSWLHISGVVAFSEMTNIPKQLQMQLDKEYFIAGCHIEIKSISKIDETVKYLFKLNDGEFVEAVVMKYKHGNSVCISSQVGCKMGCTFCATGKSGFTRNLLPSEMLSEVMTAQKDFGGRISNIVLMGMGEPLDNFDNVLKFIELVTDENGLNIGMRHISLSTCGVVDKIYSLADKKLQLTLSISLHAPTNSLRDTMMPINKKWDVEALLKACKYYGKTTGRRISFEYAMIKGVNDSDSCAFELANKLNGILSHINLIPVNDVTGVGYKKSNRQKIDRFAEILDSRGFTATVRRTLGEDIDASCGQLRGKKSEEENTNGSIL